MNRWWFKSSACANSDAKIALFKPVSAAGTSASHNIVLCERFSPIWRELSASPSWIEQRFIESESVYKVYCNGLFPALVLKFKHLLKYDTVKPLLPMLLNTRKDKSKIFGQREAYLTAEEALKIHALAAELRERYRLSTFGFDVL